MMSVKLQESGLNVRPAGVTHQTLSRDLWQQRDPFLQGGEGGQHVLPRSLASDVDRCSQLCRQQFHHQSFFAVALDKKADEPGVRVLLCPGHLDLLTHQLVNASGRHLFTGFHRG